MLNHLLETFKCVGPFQIICLYMVVKSAGVMNSRLLTVGKSPLQTITLNSNTDNSNFHLI